MSDINASGVSTARLAWRRSGRSDAQPRLCVEVAGAGPRVATRDSKNPDRAVLMFTRHAWTGFARGVQRGTFDPS